ncbi:hypothetical protein Drose_06460 [Dactylosporangium roseum]|uniref:Uncharacterized protein n=1 Tax=Dactylosporangium roseum TaxID=47989 RepID=A0ABY5Z777_9ACTN|nr:hypothetical protein [Dactylosporangium roseum]UWZ37915.1 hypothetical protein Drose_06460 [Dactylosporangium roseum]
MAIDPEIRAEALAGRWEAVLSDLGGHVEQIDELREWHEDDLGETRISIVRRSAVPTGPDADGNRYLPVRHNGEDLLIEWGDFEEYDEVEARWVQAEAMVAGLNAAAGA